MSDISLSTEELVIACTESGNDKAWEEFVRRFRKLISSVVWRVARRYGEASSTVVDDLIQETYLKICADNCRLLRDFQPQHPDAFFGMIGVTAANVAHDYCRAKRSDKRGAGITECELSEVEAFVPDSHWSGPVHIERNILMREIDGVLSSLSSPSATRDREIFWLRYRQGFTTKAIAAIPSFKLTTKGVESILHRLTCLVRERLVQEENFAGKPQARAEGICPEDTLTQGEGQ
jgi:RNA polymerase sigma-70 factor (ECF subfamily)